MLCNDPRDKYLYEIIVFTGARKGSGQWLHDLGGCHFIPPFASVDEGASLLTWGNGSPH